VFLGGIFVMEGVHKILHLVQGGKETKHSTLLDEVTKDAYEKIHKYFDLGGAWVLLCIANGYTIDQILKMSPGMNEYYERLIQETLNNGV
jgi:hypothetical protein